jgi:hypothetical protein
VLKVLGADSTSRFLFDMEKGGEADFRALQY